MPATTPRTQPSRIQIHDVLPAVEGGRWPVKRSLGDDVVVECDIVRDGHEQLRAVVRHRPPGEEAFVEEPMTQLTADRWRGRFTTASLGLHEFQVEVWVNQVASWRSEVERKLAAGQEDLDSEMLEGAALHEAAASRLKGSGRTAVKGAATALRGEGTAVNRAAPALSADTMAALDGAGGRPERTRSEILRVDVDRERARVGAWYELFPRSWGGLTGVAEAIPGLAHLGLRRRLPPPDSPHRPHRPQGARTTRPSRSRASRGAPGRSAAATAATPRWSRRVGTLEDLECARGGGARDSASRSRSTSRSSAPPTTRGWREHPEWFHRRPDGTLKYAENPPKRYQDIYNVNFGSDDWAALWGELRAAVVFWVERGVRIFRVDNPHQADRLLGVAHPHRSATSTRTSCSWPRRSPARRGMYALAKAGFTPVVHLLHLEELGVGAARVRGGARRPGGRVLPPELLREHARTSSTSTCRPAAGPRSRRG